jgi:DedD protein
MASGGRRGSGDRVLESRHLVGLFLGVVLLCGVFFTLGYVMGKTQYGGLVHAAEALERNSSPARAPEKPSVAQPPAAPAPSNGEWDFYTKNGSKDGLQQPEANASPMPSAPPHEAAAPKSVTSAPSSAAPAATAAKTVPASARFQPPKMLKGAIVLQVAAVTQEGDALAMADALQQKRFPAFVVTPTSDNFYRVQVGPYSDPKAAESAKGALDHAGFKAIIKR